MEVTEGGNGGRSLGCSTCRFLLSSLLDGFVEGLEAPRGWVRGYTETGELSVMASGPIAQFQGLTPFFPGEVHSGLPVINPGRGAQSLAASGTSGGEPQRSEPRRGDRGLH
jgi:hypothetical protein